tara:strand:+ start:226 stop:666 length:441 start_codon:yes stop_codon:yes gene_type:complete
MFFRISLILIAVLVTACSEPDFTDHQGNSGKFDDLGGRWMIINYWATWCKPCIEEIPELNQFSKAHANDVALFGVEFDQHQGEKLQNNIAKLGIEFPVLLDDPAPMLGISKPLGLPTTFVFNRSGKLHQVLKGPQTNATLLAAIAD